MGAAAILCSVATGAQATSMFDVFETICVDSAADPTAALAAADRMKWGAPPSRLLKLLTKPSEPGEIVTHVAGRGLQDDNGVVVLAVAETNHMLTKRTIPARACVLLAGPSMSASAINADVAAFAGVPPTPGLVTQKSAVAYLWRLGEGGRHERLRPEEVETTPPDQVRMLVAMNGKGTSILQFFAPTAGQH